MKTLINLLFIVLSSCSVRQNLQVNPDYEVVNAALRHFNTVEKFRILETPYNLTLNDYLKNFYPDTFNLKDKNFKYSENKVLKWAKGKDRFEKLLKDKIELFPTAEEVPKLSFSQRSDDTYALMSNPVFSEDGQYAMISIEFIPNQKFPDTAAPYILIFEKVNNSWVFKAEFAPYVS